MRLSLILASALFGTVTARAEGSLSPEEFSKVTDAAVAAFKADHSDHFAHFYGITLTRLVQDGTEVGISAKIFVKHSDAGQPMVMAKYVCAKNADLLACHPE